jgi:hypothetical protein
MLAGKVAFAVRKWLTRFLVTAELRVLPDLPERIRTEQKRIAKEIVEGGQAIPEPADARKNRLDL